MTCAELDQRAVDYLYGELVPAERAAVEAHLATCEACRHEVRGLERTLGVTREALRGPLAQEAPSRVRLALEQEAARVAAQAVARTAARSVAKTAAKTAATSAADAGESFWAWLRRPWFLPAVAAFSVVTLFFLAKPAILERPKHALDEVEMEARQKATQGEDRGVLPAANSPAPEPAAGAAEEAPAEDRTRDTAQEPARRRRVAREVMNERGPEKKGDAAKVSAPAVGASAPRPAASRWATPPPATTPRPEPPTAALEQAASAKKSRADDDTSAGRGEGSVATGAASGGGAPAGVGSLRGRAGASAAPAGQPEVSKRKSVADDPLDGLVLGGPVARAPAPPPAAAPSKPARRAPPPAAAGQPAPASPPAAAPAPAPRAPRDAVESVMESAASKEDSEADSESTVVRELPLPELRKRADLAFQQSRWDRAIRDYRELLRRFGTHADAPLWRRRLDISTHSAGR